MSKSNATTKRKKVARVRKLTTMQLQAILEDIEPKVGMLWTSAWEHHRALASHDALFAALGELRCGEREVFEMRIRLLENALRSHEYLGHGKLVSMPEAVPLVQPTAAPRPQLRLLKGGLPESTPPAPSSDRPQLHVL